MSPGIDITAFIGAGIIPADALYTDVMNGGAFDEKGLGGMNVKDLMNLNERKNSKEKRERY
jgi:hypothetical protein